MNYKEAVCQAAIALWASAKPSYNSNPEAAVEQGTGRKNRCSTNGFRTNTKTCPETRYRTFERSRASRRETLEQ